MLKPIACVLALLPAAAATAQSWSLAAMAAGNPQANPNGPWSYRYTSGPTNDQLLAGPFPAYYGIQGEYLWWNQASFPTSALCDINATGQVINYQTISFGPDTLRLDPQNSGTVFVRFTAPLTGQYRVQGSFATCDVAPHTKYVTMWIRNGQFGMPYISQNLTTGSIPFDAQNVSLSAGQVIDFGIASVGGDASYLSTCVSAIITLSGAACYANCDGSTAAPILNVNDFICFQTKFAAADTYANCDGSTLPPVLNVNDFICFQQRFAAGCP